MVAATDTNVWERAAIHLNELGTTRDRGREAHVRADVEHIVLAGVIPRQERVNPESPSLRALADTAACEGVRRAANQIPGLSSAPDAPTYPSGPIKPPPTPL